MKRVLRDVRDGAILVEYPGASDDEANRRRGRRSASRLRGSASRRTSRRDSGRADAARRVRSGPAERGATRAALRAGRWDRGDRRGLAAAATARRLRPARTSPRSPAPPASRRRSSRPGTRPRDIASRSSASRRGSPTSRACRRSSPRRACRRRGLAFRRASVAIGGPWTGVYPDASPGGWRLIGRTSRGSSTRGRTRRRCLAPGDRVEFARVASGGAPPAVQPRPSEPVTEGSPFARVVAPGPFTTIQGARAPRSRLLRRAGGRGDGSGVPRVLQRSRRTTPPTRRRSRSRWPGRSSRSLAGAVLAAGGGEASIDRNGRAAPFAEAFRVEAGDRLRIGRIERRARVYLAVAGGLRRRRKSASWPETCLRRRTVAERHRAAPARGPAASPTTSFCGSCWGPSPRPSPRGRSSGFSHRRGASRRRATAGACASPASRSFHGGPPEIPPSGTVPGSIQVPGSGLPIVLGPDGPVTGGYPRIATVVSADLGLLGQARPGPSCGSGPSRSPKARRTARGEEYD